MHLTPHAPILSSQRSLPALTHLLLTTPPFAVPSPTTRSLPSLLRAQEDDLQFFRVSLALRLSKAIGGQHFQVRADGVGVGLWGRCYEGC